MNPSRQAEVDVAVNPVPVGTFKVPSRRDAQAPDAQHRPGLLRHLEQHHQGPHVLEAGRVEHFILVWTENGVPAHAEVRVANLPPDDDGLLKRP